VLKKRLLTKASRRNPPRVHNKAVKEAAAGLAGSEHRRATAVSSRLEEQQRYLNLPIPQTPELRRVRREVKSKKISRSE
jgi:5-methyltetrahydropteroyltriglutamate--homocysteine methyltransferase